MLEIVNFNEDSYEFPCLLVLGCFDSLHVGHADLLKKAKLQAKINGLDLGVMMFAEGKGGKQVFTFEERVKRLEQFNVKFVLKIDFNDEFKKIPPLDFLAILEDKLNVKAYMSGKDFRFGAGAKGKSSTLKNYAEDEENGVWYMSVKDVTCGDEKVSTTLVKKLLESGNIAHANELLGRNYYITATSANTDGNALTLAYPDSKVQIPGGEYRVKCTVGETEYAGTAQYQGGDTLTVNLEGFGGNYNGEEIILEFTSTVETIAQTPSSEQPAEQPAPVEEQVPEAAVEEMAVTEEIAEETPVEETPAEEIPVEETPAEETPVEEIQFEENSVEEAEFEDELNEEFEETQAEEIQQPAEEVIEEPETQEPAVEEIPAEGCEEPAEELSEEEAENIMEDILAEKLAEEQTEEPAEDITDTEEDGDINVD